MGKLVLYIAVSLDGFIAGEGESLQWLDSVEGQGDNGYADFYKDVDTAVMGRKTYDWILAHSDFPYPGKECYVFSRTSRENTDDVTFVSEDAAGFVSRLKAQSEKRIWLVGGGRLLHTLLEAELVDEMILTVAPVVLGKGIPLFYERKERTDLALTGMERFGQFAVLHYTVSHGQKGETL